MNPSNPVPPLPFELIEPILITRLATLRRTELVPDNLHTSGKRTDPSSDQKHLAANREIHTRILACLCVLHPSPAMCASAARLSSLDVRSACKSGHLARLNKLHAIGLCTDTHGQAIGLAITSNNVAVLDWWTHKSLPISPQVRLRLSVESALECGAFDTAKWVAEHRVPELKNLSLDALEHPILHDRVDVVHAWLDWKDAKLLGDFEHVLVAASKMSCLDVFKRVRTEHAARFLETVQEGHVLERALVDASKRGDARVLQLWISVGLGHGMAARVERVAGKCVQVASGEGQVEALRVWKRSKVPLEYSNLVVDLASAKGHLEVLEWWKQSALEIKYSEDAITGAAREDRYVVLEWWRDSGLPLKIDLAAVLIPALECSDRITFLDWWVTSGLPLSPLPAAAMDSSLERGDEAELGWWERVLEREPGRVTAAELYSGRGVLHAIMNGAQGTLDWMCRRKMDPRLSKADMELACKKRVCAQVVDLYTRVGGGQGPSHALHCPLSKHG